MKSIEICVTSACNLRCLHCYQSKDKNTDCISFEMTNNLLLFLKQQQIENIVYSGGEFFMHPNSYNIIDISLSITNAKITIQNNGTVIDAELFVQKYGTLTERILLSFSMDGFEEDHNRRRGIGSFKKLMANSDILMAAGFKCNVIITIDSHNISYLPELIEFATSHFSTITLLCIGNTGAAYDNEEKLGLKNSDLKELTRYIYQYLTDKPSNRRCNMFPNSLSVKYDGSVYPCSVARDMDIYKMGNINNDSIDKIIEKFSNSAEGKEILAYKSRLDIPKCKTCPKNDLCIKGCRIRAKKVKNVLLSPDPFACFVYGECEYDNKSASDIFWGNV